MPADAQEMMFDNLEQAEDDLFDESSKPIPITELEPDVPVLFSQCVSAYNLMYLSRSHETYSEDGSDIEYPVWIGKLTILLEERANIPITTYSRVVGALIDMNCVIQLQRGSRRELGRWVLVHRPTMQAFEGMQHARGRKKRVRQSNLSKRITQLHELCAEQQKQINFLMAHLGFDPTALILEEVKDGETKSSD